MHQTSSKLLKPNRKTGVRTGKFAYKEDMGFTNYRLEEAEAETKLHSVSNGETLANLRKNPHIRE
jgi:hypothetical protein